MTWGIGRYLEERRGILRNFPQMITENRIYHVGLDIVVPEGAILHTPISGNVFDVGKEEGPGNYGGYVILRHQLEETVFYCLYGHLFSRYDVRAGEYLRAGEPFGAVGGEHDSGGWFTHVHMQILTERALREKRMFQGYVAEKDLPHLEELFPSPMYLFRYKSLQ